MCVFCAWWPLLYVFYQDTWLGNLKMALAAEYGFYYRYPDEDEWQTMVPEIDTSWRDIVRPILEVRKCPGHTTWVTVKHR